MRSGAPDAVPDEILAARTEASVYHTPLPGVGLGLVLDPTVEAALREDGFDLTRVAPDPNVPLSADASVVLPLRSAAPPKDPPAQEEAPDHAIADLRAAIDRLERLAGPDAPRPDLQALCAVLLGAGTLAARGATTNAPTLGAPDAHILDRLTGIEATLQPLTDLLTEPARHGWAAQGD